MEFNQRLQELRKLKGLTQEELACELYVSRTAVSKWESGRGYPNIDSLKLIAKYFSVTVDELLSSSEAVELATAKEKEKNERLKNLTYGIADISMILLAFLPLFAQRDASSIISVSLITLNNISAYLKILYFFAIFCLTSYGVLELALQNVNAKFWMKCKAWVSLGLSFTALLLFILSLQPYPALITVLFLSYKVIIQIIRK